MGLKGVIGRINKARDAYIERREREAKRKLERLTTQTARRKEQLKLQTERSKAREQAEKAKAAALKAEAARKKAQQELRQYGVLVQMGRALRSLGEEFDEPRKRRRTRKSKR